MARAPFLVEKAFGITAENGQSYIEWSRGSGAPSADAEIGSLYTDTASGLIYRKAVAGAGAGNWTLFVSAADLNSIAFKAQVKAATSEALSAGARNLSTTPFTDDDGTDLAAGDFAVNDFVIGGVGGTPIMYKVTNVSAPSITLAVATGSEVLEQYDNYVVQHYLPDVGDAQETQALVQYNGSAIIKLGDFNWSLANGINLTSGYVGTTNGTPAASDTVETAITKLDANQRDLTTLSGVAQGAVDLSTFTGETIPDNSTIKAALQSLETELEGKGTAAAITAITTVDSVLVDDKPGVLWIVTAFEDATPANKQSTMILALHNGTASADATAVDDTSFGKLDLGSNFNLSLSVDLNGAGGAQVMRLRAASSSAGVTVTARRLSVY